MTDFSEAEFREISRRVQETGEYNLELILRVKNFKSQVWLKPDPSWESVLKIVNGAIKEAEEIDDICAPFKKLCGISGISVPTASALLATWAPDRYAVIDRKMFKFFTREDAYSTIKSIFGIPDNDDLRMLVEDAKEEFDATCKKGWEDIYQQIYPKYLNVLRVIRDKTSHKDIRGVERKIWCSS